jgi:hypothetical protein
LPLGSRLGAKAEHLAVGVVHLDSGVVLFIDHLLIFAFLLSLVFLGFNDLEFLLLDPLSVDLTLGNDLLGGLLVSIKSLAFVVLCQSQRLWLVFLGFFLDDFFGLLYWSFVFLLVKDVLKVSDVASSSSFLSGSVTEIVINVTLCRFHFFCREHDLRGVPCWVWGLLGF